MVGIVALKFIDLFVSIFNLLLIARVLCSYILRPENSFYAGLVAITEPLLAPLRRVLPSSPGIDWTPLVAFFLLQGLQYLAHAVVGL